MRPAAPIRIGTRGSALALWQAREVARQLTAAGAATEIVVIRTTGDRLGEAAAALPVRQRTLLVGLDQADIMAGLFCRQSQPDG